MPSAKIQTFKKGALIEAKKFMRIFLYFWVMLSLFALQKFIVVEQSRLSSDLGFALINALVLAKIMLIGEDVNLADRFKERPLIYPVIYKSLVFAVLLIGFNVLEETIRGWWKGETIAASLHELNGGRLGGIVITATILFIALIPFFAFKELSMHIGEGKLYELFFVRRTKYVPLQ